MNDAPMRGFVSYSHEDTETKSKLMQHLSALQRQGLIDVWHDSKLCVGDEFDPVIQQQLAASRVVILLISPSFISSDYCFDKELAPAFERHLRGDARVVPIIIRPCQWTGLSVGGGRTLANFLAFPQDGKPVTEWPNVDAALDNAVGSIKELLRRDLANASKPKVDASQLTEPRGATEADEEDGDTASQIGLLGVFPDRGATQKRIERAVMEADWVRVLSNKGDDWLSEEGVLAQPLLKRAERGDRLHVEMLLLHISSPWLLGRGMSKGFWQRTREEIEADFRPAHRRVVDFAASLGLDPPRFHRQDPSWRFMMTDHEMFLQTYKTNSQMTNERVIHLSRRSPIYASASRYFEYLYELGSAPLDELSPVERLSQKTLQLQKSAGYVLTRQRDGRQEALVIFKDDTVVLPKGGLEGAAEIDDPMLAARRELREETGIELEKATGRFMDSVVVGQPFVDNVSCKMILIYHVDADEVPHSGTLVAGAEWADETRLRHAIPGYDYIPGILRKVGISPKWRSPPYGQD